MDKQRLISYMNVYETLFSSIKENKISLLEIKSEKNDEVEFWKSYFKNGEIYGITKEDAYNDELIKKNFNNKKFNIISENGSYDINSLINFIKIYSKLLIYNGILIIHNIQSIKYLNLLKEATPLQLQPYIKIFDLREINENYDDILFIIDKTINEEIEEIEEKVEHIEIEEEKKEEIIKPDNINNIYEILFRRRRNNEIILMNIGLNEDNIRFLINYFKKSVLFGIGLKNEIAEEFRNNNRIKLYLETSPYDININNTNIKFDIIISNYETETNKIAFIINTYTQLLNTNGLLIIEDVKEEDVIKIKELLNDDLKEIMEFYDNIIIINK
jgi:hypothetical protein